MSQHAGTVVIGSGPAAVAAVESFRDHGGRGAVTVLAAEPEHPYNRPPLSKEFLRGEIGRDDIRLRESGWEDELEVELVLGHPAHEVDPGAGVVVLADGTRLAYERLLLAMGARPAMPPVEGLDLPGVTSLRTVADASRLAGLARPGTSLVVVGSGFIGCEAAASAAARGARVVQLTMEAGPQTERLGEGVASTLSGWLEAAGVELHGDSSLAAIEPSEDEALRVSSAEGEAFDCDAVLLATGVTRNVELARAADLEVATGIRTDASMRTSADAIWAAGDVAEADNATLGEPLTVEHWGEALAQGRVAGATMAGDEASWDEVPGFWSTIGDRTLKFRGWGGAFDTADRTDGDDGSFRVEYEREGGLVGLLAHGDDAAYDAAGERIAEAVA